MGEFHLGRISKTSIILAIFLTSLYFPIIVASQSESTTIKSIVPGWREAGLPYIQNFSPEDFLGSTQSWAILRDQRGIMYFGNYGVLEYDGVSWNWVDIPNQSIVRSLAQDTHGRIYVGAVGEFGYLAPDSLGQLQYISLLDHVAPDNRDFADVWNAFATSHGIYFGSDKYLFRWQPGELKPGGGKMVAASGVLDGTLRLWQPQTSFHRTFVVRDTIYVQQRETGLMKLIGDSLKLVPGSEQFASARIFIMLPFPNPRETREDKASQEVEAKQGEGKKILIGTRTQRLFHYDGRKFERFITEADAFLLENQLYHSARLQDGTIALATLRGGVVIINQQGQLQQVINKTTGLREQSVYFLYPDPTDGGTLWLALSNGLARVETPSPLSLYTDASGLEGVVQAVRRHEGRLYVATFLGVYYLSVPSTTSALPAFKPIKDIAAKSWSLLTVGQTLLAATMEGVYRIEHDRAYQICDLTSGPLYRSPYNPNVVFVGLQKGLAVLQNVSGNWRLAGSVKGVFEEVWSIVEEEPGVLWLGTANQGVVRVTLPQSNFVEGREIAPKTVERFDQAHHIPPGSVSVYTFKDQIIFDISEGRLRFNRKSQSFVRDSTTFGAAWTDSLYALYIPDTIAEGWQSQVWMAAAHSLDFGPLIQQKDGTNTWHTLPFRRLVDFGIIYPVYPDPVYKNILWMGSQDGLIRFDANVDKDYTVDFPALVRRVTVNNDSVIYGGAMVIDPTSRGGRPAPKGVTDVIAPTFAGNPILNYQNNAIRFEYAAPSYDDPSKNRYQVYLEGFDNDWSDWSNKTQKDYTNLPEGDYHLRVRAKNIYQQQSSEGVYAFTILPPWYRTWWAYGFYLAIFVALMYGSGKLRSRQLEKRNKELVEIVEDRTQEIRQQNQQLEEKNTEILRTQDQLILQEKMASLGQMTAGIAHEIKNPLNFVINFAELSVNLSEELKEELESQKENITSEAFKDIEDIIQLLTKNVTQINDHGKRANNIVNSMMDHASGAKGKRLEIGLNALVEENINLAYHGYRARYPSFNVTVRKQLNPSLPPVTITPQEIGRVLLNILNNACDALYQKQKEKGNEFLPELTISTIPGGGEAEIRIRDNGPGIPEEIRDKIFNPFFTTKPTGEGNTGLGLSISYEIVVQGHQGRITIDSKPGEFTEFVICLPYK